MNPTTDLIGSNTGPIGTHRNPTKSDEIQRNPTKKADPKDFIGFRNSDSDRISSDGRIRPDPIGPVSDS